jgi:hypothetical protein
MDRITGVVTAQRIQLKGVLHNTTPYYVVHCITFSSIMGFTGHDNSGREREKSAIAMGERYVDDESDPAILRNVVYSIRNKRFEDIFVKPVAPDGNQNSQRSNNSL